MKALVFLLVLGNLLFYAFSQGYFGKPENPDAIRLEKQVLPERMHIVSRGEAPPAKTPEGSKPDSPGDGASVDASTVADPKAAEVAKAAEAKPAEAPPVVAAKPEPPPTVCLAWDRLTPADADRLAEVLAGKYGEFKMTRRIIAGEPAAWWVYIPPLAGKAETDKKAGELRDLGVTDYFVVQDGANRNAISLGVFSSEKGSQDRLAELKDKGVRSAKVAPRPSKDSLLGVQATGPASARAALVAAVAKALPKADGQACK